MSKSRSRSPRSAPIEAAPKEKATKADEARSGFPTKLGTAVAVLGVLVYLAVFFHQKLATSTAEPRYSLFGYLTLPDVLAADWVEGSWRNFSLLDRWPIVLVTVVLLGIALLLGTISLWISPAIRQTTVLERYVLRIGIGLQLLSLLTLVGGAFGLGLGIIRFLLQIIIFAAVIWWMQWLVRRIRQTPVSQFQFDPPLIKVSSESTLPAVKLQLTIEWMLKTALVLLSLAVVLGAMLPPWNFDVREYHLQVPKEWSQQGRITILPHNVYGNMPLGAELHAYAASNLIPQSFTPRFWWWGALSGKLVMACYGPLTALLLYCAGRRFWSTLAGLTAGVVYLSNPWVIHVCVNGLNESALGFYLAAALYATFLGGKNRPCAGLAGFFAGAAASIKYSGVVFVVFPLGLWMVWYGTRWLRHWNDPRLTQPLRWRPVATVFLVMAGLTCGSWYVKNWIVTGNPTYPLLAGIFGGKTLTPEKTSRWNEAHDPPPFTGQNFTDSVVRIGWKNQFQSPLIIPLALLGITALASAISHRGDSSAVHSTICNPRSMHVLSITTFVLLFFLIAWWTFTHRLPRFLVPAIPLAALLSGAGAEYARRTPLRYFVGGLMVVGLAYNLLMAASPLVGDNRWFVSLERLRMDEPRTDRDPSRVKTAHRWLNQNVQPGQAVLCVADAAVFDLEMPVFYNTCFDDCLLVNWIEGKTKAEQKEELRQRKIVYVYFDKDEYERYTSQGNYGYDPRFSPKLLDELVSQGVLNPPLPDAPGRIYPVAP